MDTHKNSCLLPAASIELAFASRGLPRVMRRLRHSLRRCQRCPLAPGCLHLAAYHQQVDRAIELQAAGLSSG